MASPLDEVGDIPGDSEAPTSDWQAILHGNNQVVLYNSTNKAVTVTRAHGSEYGELEWEEYEHDDIDVEDVCPYCHRPMAEPPNPPSPVYPRAPNYFHLLAESTSSSRPRTPPGRDSDSDSSSDRLFTPGTLAEGYFDMFFREERKLGMGANGSVFLCQHVLDGNMLGHFAVKKIAVGSSHEYLVNILKEVRLLETLRHQNIITYHHSWLETSRFSAFGPSIPTLFVLMQWAEGGSLDDFIASRQGLSASGDPLPSTPVSGANGAEEMTKAQRIAAFRARNRKESGKKSTLKAIHLLSADEILHLFSDITSGLAFLHDRAILHLDLKPGNVLLTWDAGSLVPRAMLSDFGASRDMLQQNASARTGVTGTLEYTAPEVLQPDFTTGLFREMDTKSDMWSLGVILHKLIFFTTPFHGIDDLAALQEAITRYPGFFLTPDILDTCIRRGLPVGVLHLLTTLLDIQPLERPSSERVFGYVRTESKQTAAAFGPKRRRARRKTQDMTPSSSNSLVRAPPPPPAAPEHYSPRSQTLPPPSASAVRRSPSPIRWQDDAVENVPPSASSSQSRIQGAYRDPVPESAPSRRTSDASTNGSEHTPAPRPTISPINRPDIKLPIPQTTSGSLLRVVADPTSLISPRTFKGIKNFILIAKIVSLAQYSHTPLHFNSPLHSTLICLAAILAVIDVWDTDLTLFNLSSTPSSASTSTTPATSSISIAQTSSIIRSALISGSLAIVHVFLLFCLRYYGV